MHLDSRRTCWTKCEAAWASSDGGPGLNLIKKIRMPLLCMPIRAGHKTIVTLPLSRETKWRFGTIFSGTVTGENVWALKRGKSQMSSSATDCVYITGIYENIFFLLLCGCKLAPMPAFPSQPYVPPRTPIGT